MKFFNEFKEFIMRGNVVDMAVGVVVGGAFKSIIDSLVKDLIMPCIGATHRVQALFPLPNIKKHFLKLPVF